MATNEQAVRTIPKRTHSYNNAPLDSNNGRRNSNPVTPNDIHVTDTGIVREKQGKVYCDNKPPKVELIKNGDFSVEGVEEITNGDFATDSDWSKQTGWTISRGTANFRGVGSGNRNIYQTIMTVGRTYTLKYDVLNFVRGGIRNVSRSGAITRNTNGTYTEVFVATYSSLYLKCDAFSELSIDNVSVKELGADWSLGGGWGVGSDVATHSGSTNANISQNVPLVVGTAYDITYTVVNASAGSQIGIAPNSLNIQYPRTSDGTYTETFTASLTNLYIRSLWNNGNPVSVDNISLSRTVLETEYLYHEVLVRDEFNNLVALVRNSNEGDISTGSYENNQGVKNRPVPRTKTVDGRTSRNIDSNGQPTL